MRYYWGAIGGIALISIYFLSASAIQGPNAQAPWLEVGLVSGACIGIGLVLSRLIWRRY